MHGHKVYEEREPHPLALKEIRERIAEVPFAEIEEKGGEIIDTATKKRGRKSHISDFFVQVPIALLRHPVLKPISIRVAVEMLAFAQNQRICYMSMKTVSANLKVSDRHVATGVEQLKDLKLIFVSKYTFNSARVWDVSALKKLSSKIAVGTDAKFATDKSI